MICFWPNLGLFYLLKAQKYQGGQILTHHTKKMQLICNSFLYIKKQRFLHLQNVARTWYWSYDLNILSWSCWTGGLAHCSASVRLWNPLLIVDMLRNDTTSSYITINSIIYLTRRIFGICELDSGVWAQDPSTARTEPHHCAHKTWAL